MHKIYANIDKLSINKMPVELFSGRIFTISTVSEAQKAVDYLKQFSILGLDTETRPNFTAGHSYKVGLLQVSTEDTCFLFRLNNIDLPNCLIELLSDKKQLKVGLSLKDDIRALRKRRPFTFGKYIELQQKVQDIGIKDMSLQKIYANLFDKKISKNKRLTNWDAPILTPEQKRYAATDAWACIKIYQQLEKYRTGLDFEYIAPMSNERMFNLWIDNIINQIKLQQTCIKQ